MNKLTKLTSLWELEASLLSNPDRTPGRGSGWIPQYTPSAKDPVTAMLQSVDFTRRLEQELERNHSRRRPLALILFEIERMEDLEQTMAELTVRTLSSRLWDSAQTEDRLGRLSAELFAFLLPGSGHFHALALAESVVHDVWNHCTALQVDPFTLKGAVAAADIEGAQPETVETLLAKTRCALGQASCLPSDGVRERVRLFRKDDTVAERKTLVLADEKQFLFFGGIV